MRNQRDWQTEAKMAYLFVYWQRKLHVNLSALQVQYHLDVCGRLNGAHVNHGPFCDSDTKLNLLRVEYVEIVVLLGGIDGTFDRGRERWIRFAPYETRAKLQLFLWNRLLGRRPGITTLDSFLWLLTRYLPENHICVRFATKWLHIDPEDIAIG